MKKTQGILSSNSLLVAFYTTERPDRFFQQHYSRKNKDITGVPPPSSDAPLNDITMPSNDSSRIDYEVQNSSPLTFESTALNP